jgi:hypothetical protein
MIATHLPTRLLCASALILVSAAAADAKSRPGLHAHAPHARVSHRAVRVAPPKDPYADYWNDPSRQGFPSWGLTGN